MKLPIRRNWLLATAIAAMPVLAADSLGVKTGTWETTVNSKTSGMAMPAEAMAGMNPQQRAQMEAMMSKMAGAPHSTTSKSCITQKDIDEGAFRSQQMQEDSKCTYKSVASSGKHQEWTFDCPDEHGASSGRMVVDATDSTHVTGTISIKAEGATIDSTFTSKWLGASCDGADK